MKGFLSTADLMKGLADDELPKDAPVRTDVYSDFDFTVLKLDWPLK